MQQKPIMFAYHPVSGLQLTATLDYVPGLVPRTIQKIGGVFELGEASETDVDWNAAEQQCQQGDVFLADDAGNVCLQSEVVWRLNEFPRIDPRKGAISTAAASPNQLRQTLLEISSAAREVFLDLDSGKDAMESALQLKALLEAKGLWEDFTD